MDKKTKSQLYVKLVVTIILIFIFKGLSLLVGFETTVISLLIMVGMISLEGE